MQNQRKDEIITITNFYTQFRSTQLSQADRCRVSEELGFHFYKYATQTDQTGVLYMALYVTLSKFEEQSAIKYKIKFY